MRFWSDICRLHAAILLTNKLDLNAQRGDGDRSLPNYQRRSDSDKMTLWTRIVYLFDYLVAGPPKLSVFNVGNALQIPFNPSHASTIAGYPIFHPPDDLDDVADPDFRCEYPAHPAKDGWYFCNTESDRKCWLKNNKTGKTYDINTDYEIAAPAGRVREYYLELSESVLNPDGAGNVPVQLFNGSFPGPRLQACWGDQIRITINNTLSANGTSVHWHGFRQWKTSDMDGVNAVTQCPIAPGESFTYAFNATQVSLIQETIQCQPLTGIISVRDIVVS